MLLFYTLVHLHFIFAFSIWGRCYLTYLRKLQRLQNKAVRIRMNSNFIPPITLQFHKLGILRITDLHKFEIPKIMHQYSSMFYPQRLIHSFLMFLTFILPYAIKISTSIMHTKIFNKSLSTIYKI